MPRKNKRPSYVEIVQDLDYVSALPEIVQELWISDRLSRLYKQEIEFQNKTIEHLKEDLASARARLRRYEPNIEGEDY